MNDRNNTESSGVALNIAVIGAGLVGSLAACYLARQGHNVSLYDYRDDVRKTEILQGRSVNLAISTRGRAALNKVGLEYAVIKEHGLPMVGRMIHTLKSSKYSIPYDAVNKKCIYSANRKYMNELLVSAAEAHPSVKLFFKTKLISLNPDDGVMTLLRTESNEVINVAADLIIGADGAYSTVRREFLKHPLFNYSQEYIEHGYKELYIPPGKNGHRAAPKFFEKIGVTNLLISLPKHIFQSAVSGGLVFMQLGPFLESFRRVLPPLFVMEPNYLHIWPRSSFMMIALPNQDKSWTVTLFMPLKMFTEINTPASLLQFFRNNFPDALKLISETRLIDDYFSKTPSHLISVKCKPFHIGSKILLIGDAAHAMVPFFGQGMNAGFEDCLLLDNLMTKFQNNLNIVLPEFSKLRCPDAHVICDLAMYNYIEMRELVNKRTFLLRKHLDNLLYRILSSYWLPLYNSVTFTEMNYSQCMENKKFQDKVVWSGFITLIGAIILMILHFRTSIIDQFNTST